MRPISLAAATELAAQLDIDVDDVAICHACLSFVSLPLDHGDERETARATAEFAPILWEEGLALPARLALGRARTARVPGAETALADVEAWGARSVTARAIVRRLAADLSARARGELLRMGFQPWPSAELK